MKKKLTSGDFLVDKLFEWAVMILHCHPIVVSRAAFIKAMGRKEKENDIVTCMFGLLESDGGLEKIYINPAVSFEMRRRAVLHECLHLLFASMDEVFAGNLTKGGEWRSEKEILAIEKYVWKKLSQEQKDLLEYFIKNRRKINPINLPQPKPRK